MVLFRNQILILDMLLNSEEAVSGNAIADFLNSSLKTIKKEIDELNFLCRENGCEIISKVGTGYEISVTDNELFLHFKEDVVNIALNHYYYFDDQQERLHYIARRFLTGRSIYINDLAYECSVSESTIRRDMPLIRELFAEYKLYLANRTNKGMSLEGDEWHIRMAFLNEDFIYNFNVKSYFTDPETTFENMMLTSSDVLPSIMRMIRNILNGHEYYLSYSNLIRFTKLLILTYNRQKEKNMLIIPSRCKDILLDEEKQIVSEIIEKTPYFSNGKPNEAELFYLSAYLKCGRILEYDDFVKLPDSEHFEKMAESFVTYMREKTECCSMDTDDLRKDLCVELYKLHYMSLIDVSLPHQFSHQLRRDGLANLDLCIMLYFYTGEVWHEDWDAYNISNLYHAFMRFSSVFDKQNRIKVLVVSKQDIHTAESFAQRINMSVSSSNITFVPMEYMKLRSLNMKEYAGIISNITELKEEYPQLRFRNLNFIRDAEEMRQLANYFLLSYIDFQKMFTIDDLYEGVNLKTEEEIYEYVKSILPGTKENKEAFIVHAKKKNSVYGSCKMNNVFMVSTVYDVLQEDVFKLIYLKKSLVFNGWAANKILVWNVAGNDRQKKKEMSSKIGNFFRTYDTLMSNDKAKDYEKLCQIFYQ